MTVREGPEKVREGRRRFEKVPRRFEKIPRRFEKVGEASRRSETVREGSGKLEKV